MIKTLPYPQTDTDSVVDNYHGTLVADPYRWLEDDNSTKTKEWVKAQNLFTQVYLRQLPLREELESRLKEICNYTKMSIPTKVGNYYFFLMNDGSQNQDVLYRVPSLDAEGLSQVQIFLDPNTFAEDGTTALSTFAFSANNKFMAYSLAQSGSDWVKFYILDVHSGERLSDCIEWVKFSEARWSYDSKGFFYSGYDQPSKENELSGENRFQKVFYHELGQDSSCDRLIFEDKQHPLRYFNAEQSKDGKYIFISCSEGTHGCEIIYKKTSEDKFEVLLKGFENDYQIVECKNDKLIVSTNHDAPNYKVISIDLNNKEQKDLISEDSQRAIDEVTCAGGDIFVRYLYKAQNQVSRFNIQGKLINKLELPALSRIDGFRANDNHRETSFSAISYTQPSTIYSYNLESNEINIIKQPKLNFCAEDFITEQISIPSKDGQQVSMFITRKRDTMLNGENRLYLYGYGGFNISLTPNFKPLNIAMLEQGIIHVEVNLRGGGEYGEKWHRAGMLENKQTVFDDFIASAEYLIAQGYTSKEKLAIAGGSNGGLLVGACLAQRPELFAVALPAVGVLDMLRYHRFTIGWGWVVEYGSADKEQDFNYLYKYSPLHNIKQGESYPATLITTADHDDRVVPAHSFKFAATMQSAQSADKPVLLRVDSNAGHGLGKSLEKIIKEGADVLSFMMYNTKTLNNG